MVRIGAFKHVGPFYVGGSVPLTRRTRIKDITGPLPPGHIRIWLPSFRLVIGLAVIAFLIAVNMH